MARLHEIKRMMLDHDVSVLDINWLLLKQGELKRLLKWEMNQHPKLGCGVKQQPTLPRRKDERIAL